jgi:single-stranded-DNA-specific exonuclease
MMLPSITADCHAAPHELSELAVKQLEQLGPFGRANPKPRVVLRRLSAVWDAKRMGREGKHLNLTVSAARGDARAPCLRLVGWNMGDRAPSLHAGVSLDAVIEPKLNHWNGRTSVQGVIADLCVSD